MLVTPGLGLIYIVSMMINGRVVGNTDVHIRRVVLIVGLDPKIYCKSDVLNKDTSYHTLDFV